MGIIQQGCISSVFAVFALSGSVTTMPDLLAQTPNPNPSTSVDCQTGTTVTIDAEEIKDFLDGIEAQKLLPSMEILEQMAVKLTPPQEWFDEEF